MCYCHCPPLHIHYAPSTIHMEDQPAPAGAPCFIPPSEFYFTAAFRFYLLFFCCRYFSARLHSISAAAAACAAI